MRDVVQGRVGGARVVLVWWHFVSLDEVRLVANCSSKADPNPADMGLLLRAEMCRHYTSCLT